MILQAAPSTGYARFPPENYGGVEDFIYETSLRLGRSRDVGVLYSGQEIKKTDAVKQEGFRLFRTPLTRFTESTPLPLLNVPLSLANNAFAAVRLASAARLLDHELLHLHESHTQFLLAKRSKAPKAFTFHGSHTCIPYERQTMHARLLAWKFDRNTAKHCDHLIAISKASKKNIVSHTGFAEEDVSVVHHGINTDSFRPRGDTAGLRAGLRLDGRPVLVSVTRVAHDKGLDLALKAAAILKKDFPGIMCMFCGISPGDLQKSPYGKELLGIISRNGLWKNVHFPGKVSRAELPRYISLADVFVHPARVEAFGLAVGEAMACSKPAVCMEGSGGPDDMVIDGKNGFLVSRENVDALAGRISYLLENAATARGLGRQARKRILENFTWDQCTEKLELIYTKLLT